MEEEEEPKQQEVKQERTYVLPDIPLLEIFNNLELDDKNNFGVLCYQCRGVWRYSECWNDAISWEYCFPKITILLGNLHYAEFNNEHDYTFKIGQIGHDETWTQKIPRSKTYFEHARNMFQARLERYQGRVKSLTIKGTCPINLRRIEHFPQLHTLILSGTDDMEMCHEILLKTGNLLKRLTIDDVYIRYHKRYVQFQQIYRVSEFLSIDFNLRESQLKQLSARKIEMWMGKLRPQSVFRFIQTWMNGTRILEKCVWNLKGSDFKSVSAETFFQCFGSEMTSREHHQLYIGGNGKITYRKDDILQFEVVEIVELD